MPYNLLDERTKKTNRDSLCEAVRTLIGYGYNIEPPDQESREWAGGCGSGAWGRWGLGGQWVPGGAVGDVWGRWVPMGSMGA